MNLLLNNKGLRYLIKVSESELITYIFLYKCFIATASCAETFVIKFYIHKLRPNQLSHIVKHFYHTN